MIKDLKCKICNTKWSNYSSLVKHIKTNHNISSKDYYDKYLQIENENICPICKSFNSYINLNLGYSRHCSMKCAQSSKKVKNKRAITCMNKFGTKTNLTSEDTIRKIKQTNLIKYGTANVSQNEKIKNKIKKTNLKKYGVENPLQSQLIKEKIEKTNLIRYGHKSHNQSNIIKEKKRRTYQKRYGVDCIFQSPIIKKKSKCTCLSKYGVPWYSQTLEARELYRQYAIQSIENQLKDGYKVFPRIGKLEPEFFEWLQILTSYKIIRPTTEMFGYFPDGYIKELKLIIEFDEPWHFTEQWATNKDKIKNQTYKKYNMNVFRVPQTEWQENPNQIKDKFTSLLDSINIK